MVAGKRWRRLVFAAIFFAAQKVALSFAAESSPPPASSSPPPASSLQLPASGIFDLVIPPDLGYVLHTHEPAAAGPIIVHIQEAHTNYEAQKHIVRILERLVQDYGLKLILVEGGYGDMGVARLRRYGSQESRRKVAEQYLRSGIISAEEYLDMLSDQPLTLWGVEEEALYRQNYDAMAAAEPLQQRLRPALASVKEAVAALLPKLSTQALNDLGEAVRAFEEERLSLAEYVDALAQAAGDGAITEEAYPNLSRFLAARALEPAIRREQVQREQQALMEQLVATLAAEPLAALQERAAGVKAGTVSREAFYAALEAAAATAGVNLKQQRPQLFSYLRYLEQNARIKPGELSAELERLAIALKERLATSAESRALNAMAEQADLLEKLVEFRLSPEEHERLQERGIACGSWAGVLNDQLVRHGLPARAFPGLEACETALPALTRFYDLARQRDQALAARALAKLAETGERLAVLITGGFHAPKITELLEARGVGVVVVAPKVTAPTDERLYHAVLKYKNGHGSFDDVMAIAHPSQMTNNQIPNTK
jgi:hypothetical protein